MIIEVVVTLCEGGGAVGTTNSPGSSTLGANHDNSNT